MKIDRNILETVSHLANTIIAVAAIAGLIFAINSSKETSEVLNDSRRILDAYFKPVLKHEHFEWTNIKGGYLDCTNLPSGVYVTYKNHSPTAISIRNYKLSIVFNNKILSETDYVNNDESIIPSGNTHSIILAQYEKFREIFKYKKNALFDPPFLEFHFSGIMYVSKDLPNYKFEIITNIAVLCEDISHYFAFPKSEHIEPIEND